MLRARIEDLYSWSKKGEGKGSADTRAHNVIRTPFRNLRGRCQKAEAIAVPCAKLPKVGDKTCACKQLEFLCLCACGGYIDQGAISR